MYAVHQAGMLSVRKDMRGRNFFPIVIFHVRIDRVGPDHIATALWRVASEKTIIHTFVTLSATQWQASLTKWPTYTVSVSLVFVKD